MKIKKSEKQLVGLSMIASSMLLAVVFVALIIKKHSVYKAILAIATVDSLAGAWLLIGRAPSLTLSFSPETIELFDDEEEEKEAARGINETL